jgi:N-terminal region of glycosyl transferase group 7/WW domain/N-terminal domain of galactosyltransferase
MSDSHANDPLPPGWSRGFSNSQKKHFYFHKETDTTQWHFPTASEARDPTVAKRRAAEAKKREALKAPAPAGSSSSNKRPRMEVGASVAVPDDTEDFLERALRTSVAIIVPFRDIHAEQKRAAHLKAFVPHMIQFLGKCQKLGLVSNFHIYIVEQSNDGLKFNRGKLLNIGFDVARKSKKRHDVFIFHDVDLLPADDLMTWYSKFPQRPIHIARVWNRYSGNPKYFGGVVSFSSSDYNRINGVSFMVVKYRGALRLERRHQWLSFLLPS